MKLRKLQKLLILSVCTLSLTACGADTAQPFDVSAEGKPVNEASQQSRYPTAENDQGQAAGSDTLPDRQPNDNSGSQPSDEHADKVPSLSGNVLSLSENSFTITPMETTVYDDGSSVGAVPAPGYEDSVPKITVKYTDATVFTVRVISGNGASYTDEEGDSSDLATGVLVDLEGAYEGEEFQADHVIINIVN